MNTASAAADGASRVPRRTRWWVEILLGLALFGVYLLIGTFRLPGHESRAVSGGQDILALEHAWNTAFERPMNLWLADRGWLTIAANYEYAFTYVAATLVAFVWLYRRCPTWYPWARNSFILLNLLAMACFWLYPVAPPRLLPGAGFVDTVRAGGTWGSWGSPVVEGANEVAAMPSLHIGWAVWVSVVLARANAGRLAQVASAVHVLVTFLVIVATGNHYWLDAAGGVAVVWLGVWGANALAPWPRTVTWAASGGNRLGRRFRRAYTDAVTDSVADTTGRTPAPPKARHLAAARGFVAEHGKPAKAIVERLGRAGARVVFVGYDGALGDVVVPSVEAGEALIEAVADVEPAEWDAETVGATVIGPAHRRRMAGPLARR